jgi:hypothetical protein
LTLSGEVGAELAAGVGLDVVLSEVAHEEASNTINAVARTGEDRFMVELLSAQIGNPEFIRLWYGFRPRFYSKSTTSD